MLSGHAAACGPEPAPSFDEVCVGWCERFADCHDLSAQAVENCNAAVCANVPERCHDEWTEVAFCLEEAEIPAAVCPMSFNFIDVDFDETPCRDLHDEHIMCLYSQPPDD